MKSLALGDNEVVVSMCKRFESETDVRLQRGDGRKVTESSEGKHVHSARQSESSQCGRDSNWEQMSDFIGVMEEVSGKGCGYIPPVDESMQKHGTVRLQRGDG